MPTIYRQALIMLLLIGCANFAVKNATAHTRRLPVQTGTTPQAPKVTGVLWVGRDLLIFGEGFEIGASVFVNGTKRKAINDAEQPTTMLIAKKAGKRLAPESLITVQVKNPGGELSEVYSTSALRTVTLADNGSTIPLQVGDRLFIYLGSDYIWSLNPFDTTVINAVPGVGTLIRGAQALLQAQKQGQTELTLTGDPPCRQSQPPCMAPSLLFHITVIVQ